MSGNAVNLKSLSRQLGLSQTTVSRALNGFPEVSERTRRRVQKAAQDANYRPSAIASSLAAGRTRVIGHVIPMAQHRMINPHFSDFLAGASEAYASAGYDMLLRAVPLDEEEDVYRDLARQHRVDAVVVHGPKLEEPRIDLLQKLGLPFVVHGRCGDAEHKSYSFLDVDNQGAMEVATRHLIELGHRKIALVNGLETMRFAADRRSGFTAAMEKAGYDIRTDYMHSADMTEPFGHSATRELITMDEPPTAVVYGSMLMAMGGMRAAANAGIKLPDDLSMVTYDDALSFLEAEGAERDDPFLTVVRSSIQEAGGKLAHMLMEKIEHPDRLLQQVMQPDFINAASTASPRDNA
ncbi:HTH-type transcriptional regulator AglR [Ahrensia sp. R2A130]|nr:HTH-type transcriptional regulator AglR [Ahrensia sp. R2A130]